METVHNELIAAIGAYVAALGAEIRAGRAALDAGDAAGAAAAIERVERDIVQVAEAITPADASPSARGRIDEGLFDALSELVPGLDELLDAARPDEDGLREVPS